MTFQERQKYYPYSVKNRFGKCIGVRCFSMGTDLVRTNSLEEEIEAFNKLLIKYAATSDGTNNFDSNI